MAEICHHTKAIYKMGLNFRDYFARENFRLITKGKYLSVVYEAKPLDHEMHVTKTKAVCSTSVQDKRMDNLRFYVLFTVFQDNGPMIMKGRVQWNPVYD